MDREVLDGIGIRCDECYVVEWRESKYTLMRTHYRMRSTAVQRALGGAQGIITSSIVGYDTLTSGADRIAEHPGFRRMVDLVNRGDSRLHAWVRTGQSVLSYRRGLLWPHIAESISKKRQTRCQLATQVRRLAPLEQQCEAMRGEIEVLRQENAGLRAECESKDQEIVELKALLRKQI